MDDNALFLNTCLQMEDEYARQWDKIAQCYQNCGVYTGLVKLLELDQKKLWVDLGCGSGRLIGSVPNDSVGMVVGVDYNHCALDIARNRLSLEGRMVNFSSKAACEVRGPPFSYVKIPMKDKSYEVRKGVVNLFFDDIRRLDLVKRYLPSKADVVSFCFGGVAASSRCEGKYALDDPSLLDSSGRSEYAVLRNNEINADLRVSAVRNAKRFLKRGGLFVFSMRTHPRARSDLAPFLADLFEKEGYKHIDTKIAMLAHEQTGNELTVIADTRGNIVQEMDIMISRFTYK